jgi:RimJ/RimL family protein N-acetyltransferase
MHGPAGCLNGCVFSPIRTDRLLIRPFSPEDAASLTERRNDAAVATHQTWALPFTAEQADRLIAEVVALEGPTRDDWWMAAVCNPDTAEVLGDLAVHLDTEGRTAEVGYTFGSAHWGHGFAVEAVERLVVHLFEDLGVTRVVGMLHPDNPASAMVLERTGFLFEGHTRSSTWVGDECSDDWIYGLTRPDWEQWRDRPGTPPDDVRLGEITAENVRTVGRLATHRTQERFVAPVQASFGDALFPEVDNGAPLQPWLRAVVADEEIVGFVMLALRTSHHPEPYLWRLLIDRLHQRRGLGHRVLDLVADECRARGDTTLLTSWEEGKGSPEPFYLTHGFVPTGEIIDGEIEGRWNLPSATASRRSP